MSMRAKVECTNLNGHTRNATYMSKEVELLDDLSKTLPEVTSNLSSILRKLSHCKPATHFEQEISRLNDETQVLKNNVLDISELYLPNIQKVIIGLKSEVKTAQDSVNKITKDAKKYSAETQNLRQESKLLKEKLANADELIASLKKQLNQKNELACSLLDQLSQERSICTSIGGTLACMLWRACREPEVVNSMLTWYKFPEFLQMSIGTLESFMDTFVKDKDVKLIPASGSDEGHFVAGMIGTITNMSASPSGREMLLANEDGQQLLVSIVDALMYIPSQQGEYLRRLILMTLYNVILDEVGLNFFSKLDRFVQAVGRDILDQEGECRTLSLHIIAAYITCLSSQNSSHGLCKYVPVDGLMRIAKVERGENGMLAMKILQNLKR